MDRELLYAILRLTDAVMVQNEILRLVHAAVPGVSATVDPLLNQVRNYLADRRLKRKADASSTL